jgi:anti-anti-sigma factor
MEISDQKQGKAMVVGLRGSLDTESAPVLQQHVKGLMEGGDTFFVLDLGGLEYISSAGLRAFLNMAKAAKAAGGGFAFCNVRGMVKELFAISYFDTMFPLRDTIDDAIQALD